MEKNLKKDFLEFLKKNNIVLLEEGDDYIKIGLSSEDPYLLDIIKRYTKKKIITEEIKKEKLDSFYESLSFIEDKEAEELASEAPIVRLVNEIIEEAIKRKATDIHIEPYEKRLIIKYRIDGILHSVNSFPVYLHPAVISRIKILSQLNIAEKRLPQDGKFPFRMNGEEYDIRVSILPTIYGESAVLRILNKNKVDIELDKLGFSNENLQKIKRLINVPNGMILVTGPTGSGKTTTLYALLKILNDGTRKIITVEDPVEYTIQGITQVQINEKIGLTFSKTLRSILRQDPDIIMIGEIRDRETAEIAVRAALTGHLVLATLHTNDSAGAFTRLINMGVESFLVASSVIGVISQRLVRRICENCKVSFKISETDRNIFKLYGVDPPENIYKGSGCPLCNKTGFYGRTAIAEVLETSESIRESVAAKEEASKIRKLAESEGMVPLILDGLRKVKEGVTTIGEILRVWSI